MRQLAMYKLTLLLFLLVNGGCSTSALQNAKTTVATVGLAWQQLDETFAPAYEQARIDARETSSTWEERDEKIGRWETARTAIVSAGMALKSAAMSITIAEEHSLSTWREDTERALGAVEAAITALESLDLKVPDPIKKLLQTGKLILDGG